MIKICNKFNKNKISHFNNIINKNIKKSSNESINNNNRYSYYFNDYKIELFIDYIKTKTSLEFIVNFMIFIILFAIYSMTYIFISRSINPILFNILSIFPIAFYFALTIKSAIIITSLSNNKFSIINNYNIAWLRIDNKNEERNRIILYNRDREDDIIYNPMLCKIKIFNEINSKRDFDNEDVIVIKTGLFYNIFLY